MPKMKIFVTDATKAIIMQSLVDNIDIAISKVLEYPMQDMQTHVSLDEDANHAVFDIDVGRMPMHSPRNKEAWESSSTDDSATETCHQCAEAIIKLFPGLDKRSFEVRILSHWRDDRWMGSYIHNNEKVPAEA